MLPNESTPSVALSTGGHAVIAIPPDADFEVRWSTWRSRGIAHERAVRRKLILVAGVGGVVATAGAVAYTLLRP